MQGKFWTGHIYVFTEYYVLCVCVCVCIYNEREIKEYIRGFGDKKEKWNNSIFKSKIILEKKKSR